jgi:hypothetical protein
VSSIDLRKKKLSFTMFWSRKTRFSRSLSRKTRFLVFIDKYTLKCPLSICEKKKVFSKKSKFNFVLRFSQNHFFHEKSSESPPFLSPGTSDRAETFFTDTRDTLGCLFFFVLENIVLSIFGRYYKKSCSWKTCTFKGALGILTFFLERNEIERKKKIGTPKCP